MRGAKVRRPGGAFSPVSTTAAPGRRGGTAQEWTRRPGGCGTSGRIWRAELRGCAGPIATSQRDPGTRPGSPRARSLARRQASQERTRQLACRHRRPQSFDLEHARLVGNELEGPGFSGRHVLLEVVAVDVNLVGRVGVDDQAHGVALGHLRPVSGRDDLAARDRHRDGLHRPVPVPAAAPPLLLAQPLTSRTAAMAVALRMRIESPNTVEFIGGWFGPRGRDDFAAHLRPAADAPASSRATFFMPSLGNITRPRTLSKSIQLLLRRAPSRICIGARRSRVTIAGRACRQRDLSRQLVGTARRACVGQKGGVSWVGARSWRVVSSTGGTGSW
jgi:hypothetical protein